MLILKILGPENSDWKWKVKLKNSKFHQKLNLLLYFIELIVAFDTDGLLHILNWSGWVLNEIKWCNITFKIVDLDLLLVL